MYDFNYIIDKINSTEFDFDPFKHIYIENFLVNEHFDHIVNLKDINLPKVDTTQELCDMLLDKSYKPVTFPGCTKDIDRYIMQQDFKKTIKYKTPELTEGIGISFRLTEYKDTLLKELVEFLNSNLFLNTLKNKFDKTRPVTVETAVQKYVSGYEISPHPDIRKKCLTYMVNINPSPQSEDLNFHTHYMKFKEPYSKVYDYWKTESKVDRCWVPWSWAETKKRQIKNNSIVIFAPDNDTLHAVKADYNHLETQRTQFYGNLWYSDAKQKLPMASHQDLIKLLSLN